tara:strand:+ start:343 stop:582 length:240 start_codon:yes stop_codon:yes gene_type:complete
MNIFRFMDHCISYDIANNSIRGAVAAGAVYFLGVFLPILLLAIAGPIFPKISFVLLSIFGVLGFFYFLFSLFGVMRWKQ